MWTTTKITYVQRFDNGNTWRGATIMDTFVRAPTNDFGHGNGCTSAGASGGESLDTSDELSRPPSTPPPSMGVGTSVMSRRLAHATLAAAIAKRNGRRITLQGPPNGTPRQQPEAAGAGPRFAQC